MSADLHAHRVTALAITPGFLRSEAVLDHLFVVRSRLYQAELDPSAAAEADRLRAWLQHH